MKKQDEILLENEIEARLLSSLLEEESIPHFLRSYHDSAYDGIFQAQLGWGRVEADERYHDRIREVLEDMRNHSEAGPQDEASGPHSS